MLTSTAKTAPTTGSVTAGASAIGSHRIVASSSQVAPKPLAPPGPSVPPRRQRTLWSTVQVQVPCACVHARTRARVYACVEALRARGRACARACVRESTQAHLVRDEAATVHDELSWLIAGGGERAHIDHLWQMLAGDLREGHCEAD